jgi:hypothetical protein
MGDSPQRDGTHEGSVVHESNQPIYDIAQLCSKHFEHLLETADGTGEDYLAIEELRGRFNQWAAYVGAFAVPRASLDARLAPHEDIRDMVLELLYMIQSNLKWSNFVLFTAPRGCTDIVYSKRQRRRRRDFGNKPRTTCC